MHGPPLFAARALAAVLSLALAACDEGLAPPSEVNTLRILGVQKSSPYASPGEDVSVSLLWHDPEGRPLTPAWFPICVDPPGDLYHQCFADAFSEGAVAEGDVYSFTVPSDVVSRRGKPRPGQPEFGLMFSIFALCAGQLKAEAPPEPGALPLTCRDETGQLLGSDDFVVGYTSVYVFPDPNAPSQTLRNENPRLDGILINGRMATNVCVGAGGPSSEPGTTPCVGTTGQAALETTVDCDAGICVDGCGADGESSCPAIELRPLVERTTAERDDLSAAQHGRDLTEGMWIDYYVDAGAVKSPVRLLNDPATGFNEAFATSFYAPKATGKPVTIWVVVHDSRGGTNWVRTQVGINGP